MKLNFIILKWYSNCSLWTFSCFKLCLCFIISSYAVSSWVCQDRELWSGSLPTQTFKPAISGFYSLLICWNWLAWAPVSLNVMMFLITHLWPLYQQIYYQIRRLGMCHGRLAWLAAERWSWGTLCSEFSEGSWTFTFLLFEFSQLVGVNSNLSRSNQGHRNDL